MNKNKFKAYALIAATLVATACTNDDLNNSTNPADAVNILTSLTSTAPVTRADVDYAPAGATIDLYYGTPGSNQKSTYTCSADGAWTTATPLYWNDLDAATTGDKYPFYAFAPAMPTNANPAVAADQSVTGAYAASDLLAAYAATTERRADVSLSFKHVMTQVAVNLTTADAGDAEYLDLATATVNVNGVLTGYTLATAASAAEPAVATATAGTAPSGGVKATGQADKHFLVLPPQTLATGGLTVTVSLGGHTYTWKSTEALNLEAGKSNAINLKLKKSGMTLTNIVLTDWDNSPAPVNGNLGIIISGSAESVTGSAPTFASMKLWKGETAMTNNTAPADAMTYTKNAAGTWSTSTPYYLDDIAATDRFYTLAENVSGGNVITDTKTGLKDLVAAGPVEVKGGAIALNYHHLMTKLCISLDATSNFNGNITDATIATPDMKPDFTLVYDANTKAINANATGTAAYTDLTSGTSYIMVPQTLPQGSQITVTLNSGSTYTATLTSALVLQAGKKHTVNLTLSPTNVGLSIAVADWTTGTGASQTVIVDGLADDGSITTTNPATGDALTMTYITSADALSTNTKQTCTYTYQNSTWSSSAPIYWDNIGRISGDDTTPKHSFVALYTPAAGNATGGTIKDYLGGRSTAGKHSTSVSFANANKLAHLTAQLTVTLIAGEGFAADPATPTTDENAALVALLSNRAINLKAITAAPTVDKDGKGVFALAANLTPGSFIPGTAFFVAPQELTNNHTIVVKQANGNAYTVKLTDVKDSSSQPLFGSTPKLEAGKHYTLTLKVSTSKVGISGDIEPWQNLSGSGDFNQGW